MVETKAVVETAVKGAKWVVLSTLVSNACRPVFTIILARLLVPSDFGLIAYTTIFMGIVNLVQDIGLSQALIQQQREIQKSADVVYTLNVTLGIIWYLAAFGLAPYLADFFNDVRVVSILRVMALSLLILPFGSVHNTLLTKQLQFHKLFYLALIPAFIPGLVSIFLALVGLGVWSLVYGSLVAAFLKVLVAWILNPWKPRWRLNLSLARRLLSFGGAVSAERILSWLVNTLDDVLVGKWLGGAALGIYTLGFNISIAPAKYISSSLIRIAFPAFSLLQNNKDAIRNAFLKAIKYIALITVPLGVGICMTADLFVPLFLGELWAQSIPVIQLISVYGIFMSIGGLLPQVYKALGRPDIYLKYVSARCLVAVPVYCYAVPRGLIAVSIAHLVMTCIFFPVNIYLGLRIMAIPLRRLFGALWVPIAGAGGIVFITFLLQKVIFIGMPLGAVSRLALVVGMAASFYVAHVLIISRNSFGEMRNLLKTALAK